MSLFSETETVQLGNFTALVIHADKHNTTSEDIIAELPLNPFPKAVIPISGGAKYLDLNELHPIRSFINGVVDFAFEHHIMLVDGGTHTGVMKVIGNRYAYIRGQNLAWQTPPLLGFVPSTKVNFPVPNPKDEDCNLDPNHPYFVLVHDANAWGGETESMFALVNAMATKISSNSVPSKNSSIAIIVNGGLTTLEEAVKNIRIGREIIVMGGGQRAPKVIFAAKDGASREELTRILTDKTEKFVFPENPDLKKNALDKALEQLNEIALYPRITKFESNQTTEELKMLLSQKLAFLL